MTTPNPFISRVSEHNRDLLGFVRSYGPDTLDVLPPLPWNTLVTLNSAPGGGKTSILRMLTSEALRHVADRGEQHFTALYNKLSSAGLIEAGEPTVIGVLINLNRGYKSLLDLESEGSIRLLFRLLDARLTVGLLESVCRHAGKAFPADVGTLSIRPNPSNMSGVVALERLGGSSGRHLLDQARADEEEILDYFEEFLDGQHVSARGHAEMYILDALSGAEITVDGEPVTARPLLLFDDGHELAESQRDAVLEKLRDRSLDLYRWYSQRLEALDPLEVLTGSPGRDEEVIILERAYGGGEGRGRLAPAMSKAKFQRALLQIANAKASPVLARYTETDFENLLTPNPDEELGDDPVGLVASLRQTAIDLAGGDIRYDSWLADLDTLTGRDGAARLAELAVLILRDRDRAQGELFATTLTPELVAMRGSSALREAAWMAVTQKHRIPYYYGPGTLTRLASSNVEQFLQIAGLLFREMQVDIAVGRSDPRLTPARQHRIFTYASNEYWRGIRQRVPNGGLVQQFVDKIAVIAAAEASRPTIPYPPGVTGTAMTMLDRDQLMDPAFRKKAPGADELYLAISTAVANNVVSVEHNQRGKNDYWMVIYVNRLLCPQFGMPLGRGGYRERTLRQMIDWMSAAPSQPRPIQGSFL